MIEKIGMTHCIIALFSLWAMALTKHKDVNIIVAWILITIVFSVPITIILVIWTSYD